MNHAEIAAYAGAAAWLPQIISWVHSVWARPKISVIPNKQIEVGYTYFGPIFNLKMALAVEKKDVVLDQIALILKHEKGDTHSFEWMGLQEVFSEISNLENNARQIIEKNQDPIALKLNTVGLVEKFVRFQEPGVHDRLRPLINKLSAKENFLKKKNDYKFQDVLGSEELDELIKEYKNLFRWKAGRYIASFQFRSQQKIDVKDNAFVFELNVADVEKMERNLSLIDKHLEALIRSSKEEAQAWNWINPSFKRIK